MRCRCSVAMGWLPQKSFDDLRENALQLSREERKSLTFDEASQFVAPDTLELAEWEGLKTRQDITPWNAVCILRFISRAEGDPWGDH